jgi:hypothetical protein
MAPRAANDSMVRFTLPCSFSQPAARSTSSTESSGGFSANLKSESPSRWESVMPSDPTAHPAAPSATPAKPVPASAPQTEPPGPDADKDEPAPHERPPVRSDDN